MRSVSKVAFLEEAFLHCQYHSRGANPDAAIIKKQRRVEENFKQEGKKKKKKRIPDERGEQKPNYSKLDQPALHSSHCLWELLTLLANISLAWVNWVRKNIH